MHEHISHIQVVYLTGALAYSLAPSWSESESDSMFVTTADMHSAKGLRAVESAEVVVAFLEGVPSTQQALELGWAAKSGKHIVVVDLVQSEKPESPLVAIANAYITDDWLKLPTSMQSEVGRCTPYPFTAKVGCVARTKAYLAWRAQHLHSSNHH